MDHLIDSLLELNIAFEKASVPLILGGGMGIYVRTVYGSIENGERYPFQIDARATADLDIFLTAETIVARDKIESVKNVLAEQGYVVVQKAKYFQFEKTINAFGSQKKLRIDFLAAPPAEENRDRVQLSAPRVKPKGVEEFHAYQTAEAEGLQFGIEEVNVKNGIVKVVSSFNYLILKMHAFKDRKDREDEKSDKGRHHAWDIFATIVRMREADWKNAKEHTWAHREKAYLKNAKEIQKEYFSEKDRLGFLRMREYQAYTKDRGIYEPHIDKVVEDMTDLFG